MARRPPPAIFADFPKEMSQKDWNRANDKKNNVCRLYVVVYGQQALWVERAKKTKELTNTVLKNSWTSADGIVETKYR
jgi:hypothetical protein